MGYNSGKIKVTSTAKPKRNAFSRDIIVDPNGQWAHPGEVTKIPSGNITMKDVPYPVHGVDNLGNQQMMYPGMDYEFPGNMVTEYPQMDSDADYEDIELTDDEQEEYRRGGFIVEELPYAAKGGPNKIPLPTKNQNAKLTQAAQPTQQGWGDYLSNLASDIGTQTLHGLSSFGTSLIGDAVNAVSPRYADALEKYSAGFIPHTTQEQYAANRSENPDKWRNRSTQAMGAVNNVMIGEMMGEIPSIINKTKGLKEVPKQLPDYMSLEAPKGNMYGQNQVLIQQSRLLNPKVKAKFFEHQAPVSGPKESMFQKMPADYSNRITPENYEDFVKDIHSSTDYNLAASANKQPFNLGSGNYGKPGIVFSDAPLNNSGKDIINAHEKNHGIFAGTMSKEMKEDLLKPFNSEKPIPNYQGKHQADEVFARMGQFKNAIGMGDNQTFTLGHLNLIRKNYAESFLDNGITEMLAKIKPGSAGEKEFLKNMNKYAFGVGSVMTAGALQQKKYGGGFKDVALSDEEIEEYRRQGYRVDIM